MATKKPKQRRPIAATVRAAGAKRPAVAKRASRSSAATKSKALAAAPAAPVRVARRAIFIDVENTSSEEALTEVLDSLKIDRAAQSTELTAVGNWRTAAQRLARHLASLGAQLVHSAPSPGVKDWSDLWIAVAAGCWLGQSAPGDILEIVSNDRAFDAVGDAAAARGVIFRRLLHRRGGAVPAAAAEPKSSVSSRRTRGGRRRRRKRPESLPTTAVAPPTRHAPARAPAAHEAAGEPHGASREQMLGLLHRLTNGEAGRWVNLDVLENALKTEGFSRPPGSPRLVTRLRTLKEVEIDAHGRVRLAHGTPPPASADAEHPARAHGAASPPAPPKRRRRRRSKTSSAAAADAAPIETT